MGRKFCLLISAKVVPVARLSISAMFVWHQFSMKKFEARSLQSDKTQTREQLGYTPSYPALQEPQLLLALYRTAQMEQLAPPQELRQVQLHPLFVLPVTFTAFPVQLAWTVHVR